LFQNLWQEMNPLRLSAVYIKNLEGFRLWSAATPVIGRGGTSTTITKSMAVEEKKNVAVSPRKKIISSRDDLGGGGRRDGTARRFPSATGSFCRRRRDAKVSLFAPSARVTEKTWRHGTFTRRESKGSTVFKSQQFRHLGLHTTRTGWKIRVPPPTHTHTHPMIRQWRLWRAFWVNQHFKVKELWSRVFGERKVFFSSIWHFLSSKNCLATATTHTHTHTHFPSRMHWDVVPAAVCSSGPRLCDSVIKLPLRRRDGVTAVRASWGCLCFLVSFDPPLWSAQL